MKHTRILLILFLLVALVSIQADAATSPNVIRIAATTSIDNSGLLKYLLPKYTAKHPGKIKLEIVGSGKALRYGRTGKVDMVWVHSPPAEKKFMDGGYGVERHTIMRNDFVIVGPSQDPAGVASATDVLDALGRIAKHHAQFISRADDSGTNKKEIGLWKKTNIDPYASDWYLETGVGMAACLKIAEQENGYILIDRATFIVRTNHKLKILFNDPINLSNPYSVIAVNPEKHPNVNKTGVNELISWLTSSEGRQAIAGYKYNGVQLFHLVTANK
jgi:tungstate transport system substrate-binding protein